MGWGGKREVGWGGKREVRRKGRYNVHVKKARVMPAGTLCRYKNSYRHEQIENHNSLGCEQPSGLDVKQSPNAQDVFRPIPGLISCAGATGSHGVYMYTCI